MDMQPFKQLAEEAASGLKSDPELFLDVTQELQGHLEDRAEKFACDGHSEEESIALAYKAFGSPLEVAAELLQANTRRMKLRAQVRLAIRALLIPAVIVLALYLAFDVVQQGKIIPMMFSGHMSGNPCALTGASLPWRRADHRRTEEFLFLLNGDLTRSKTAARQRAIWERHPENKAYFANYAIYLANERRQTLASLPAFEREMRLGERVDPGNALYNYLLADAMFPLGANVVGEKTISLDKAIPRNVLQVTNRAVLDRAMLELRRGAAKPYCEMYHNQLYAERMAYVPPATRFAGGIASIQVMAMTPVPRHRLSKLGRDGLPLYVRLLLAEGKTTAAREYLDAWLPFVTHWADASPLMIHTLIVYVLLERASPDVAEIYDQLGEHATAIRLRKIAEQTKELREKHMASGTPEHKVMPYMGLLANNFFPRISGTRVTEDEVTNSRILEYVVLEEVMIAVLVGVLLFCMLRAYAHTVIWSHGLRAAKSAPLLLLPSWPALLRIVACAIILPLVIYYGYLHVPALSGRSYGIIEPQRLARLAVEFLLVIVTMTVLPGLLAKRMIRQRCEELGVEMPEAKKPRKRRIFWLTIGILCGVIVLQNALMLLLQSPYVDSIIIAVVGLGALAFFLPLKRNTKQFGLYYGSVARSLVPIYAVAIILIGGIAYPYLVNQEIQLVRQEKLIFDFDNQEWLPTVEERFVEQASANFRQILHEEQR